MNNVMSVALSGLQASGARFEESARRLVANRDPDLARELVTQKMTAANFKANLAVLRTADEMTKAVLDIVV